MCALVVMAPGALPRPRSLLQSGTLLQEDPRRARVGELQLSRVPAALRQAIEMQADRPGSSPTSPRRRTLVCALLVATGLALFALAARSRFGRLSYERALGI